ncbi:MAG: hypothetical protein LBI59_01275 [Candidatus Accumulibacter sp.]|jgi:hypothetical protein|nr:hypothetical protein [Accumulibacter sp.]
MMMTLDKLFSVLKPASFVDWLILTLTLLWLIVVAATRIRLSMLRRSGVYPLRGQATMADVERLKSTGLPTWRYAATGKSTVAAFGRQKRQLKSFQATHNRIAMPIPACPVRCLKGLSIAGSAHVKETGDKAFFRAAARLPLPRPAGEGKANGRAKAGGLLTSRLRPRAIAMG